MGQTINGERQRISHESYGSGINGGKNTKSWADQVEEEECWNGPAQGDTVAHGPSNPIQEAGEQGLSGEPIASQVGVQSTHNSSSPPQSGLIEGVTDIDAHCLAMELKHMLEEQAAAEKRKASGKGQQAEHSNARKKTKPIQQNLRRSVRISGRSPQTKFFTNRKKTNADSVPIAARQRRIKEAIDEAAVVQALQEEHLTGNPLTIIQADQVRGYCGITATTVQPVATATTVQSASTVQPAATNVQPDVLTQSHNSMEAVQDGWEAYEESVLAALEYDPQDDLLDEDEDDSQE